MTTTAGVQIVNAIIQAVTLGYHDGQGSIPTLWLRLDYGGAGQGFGGYALDGTVTHQWVYGILGALKVEAWERLPGTPVRVERDDNKVYRIGHLLEDRWFDPAKGTS